MDESYPLFREGIYRQIYDAAYAVARNQQPDVAVHAEDIAQGVVEKFTQRQMTKQVENPARWGAVHAAHECRNFANRQLKRERANRRDNEVLWDEETDLNPQIYPYGQVAGADAIEYTLSCLSDREREMVHLVEAGYSHAEIAEMMGYAGARSVTTTMNRIRTKILDHVGGRAELDDLLVGPELFSQLTVSPISHEDESPESEEQIPSDENSPAEDT